MLPRNKLEIRFDTCIKMENFKNVPLGEIFVSIHCNTSYER